MSTQNNIKLIKHFFETQVNKDDTSLYEEFIDPEVTIHGPASGQKIQGINNTKQIDSSYIQAYPHKQFFIEEFLGVKDRVFIRWVCKGAHKGEYKGIRPKIPEFAIAGLSIFRIKNNKIIEIWQYWDRLGLLEQIGEVSVRENSVEPGYYIKLLKSLGMEKYADKAPLLTKRERECLRCLLEGKTAKETASQYKISYRTVESFFESIKRKLNCPSKRDLFTVAQALEKLDLL